MSDMYAPTGVYIGTTGKNDYYPLNGAKREEFDQWLTIVPDTVTRPGKYCLFEDNYKPSGGAYTKELYIGLWPAPVVDTYRFRVPYLARHSKITDGASGSEDAALIVPAEFQWNVYVEGAVFILKKKDVDGSLLTQDRAFQAAMTRMDAAAVNLSDPRGEEDIFNDAKMGAWPQDRRVWITDDGGMFIFHDVSV